MNQLSPEELQKLFHPMMSEPANWRVIRYEVELDEETGLSSQCVVTFKSKSGQLRVLKFNAPRWAEFGPMRVPSAQSLYVADMTSLGWQHGRIEVGEWEEERATILWAESVEQGAEALRGAPNSPSNQGDA
jgi:hypothetical protein